MATKKVTIDKITAEITNEFSEESLPKKINIFH